MCATLSVNAVADEIASEKTDENEFVLTLKSASYYDVESSQNRLLTEAIELCGNMTPNFGRYSFENVMRLPDDKETDGESSYQFSQTITCGVAIEPVVQQNSQQSFQKASNKQIEDRIRIVTHDYFRALSNGAFKEAWAHLSQSMQSYSSFSEWEKAKAEFYQITGAVDSRSVWRVTVYDNPPGAPRPGLYVAADYFHSYANAPLHCGYLMWFSADEDQFRIVREETGHLTSDVAVEVTEEQLEQIKAQFGCSDR
jgi:hypothetical protein